MAWIQKNLVLVLGGLVGLVLLLGSALFLYAQYGREATVNTALEEKRAEWNRLIGLSPFPDEKNIKAVRDDTAQLEKLAADLRGNIHPFEVPPMQDTFSLKLLIETTISDLRQEAEDAGVGLPHNYAFTFQRLREMPQFQSNAIPRLAEQVVEVSTLLRVLFDAKVHTLDMLKRCPILKEEGNSSDYLTKRSVTNNWVVRSPYDFSFRAFSGELAEVLKGFAAMNQCVAIKTINIEPTTLPQDDSTAPMYRTMPMPMSQGMTPPGGGGPGGMDPALAARYGLMPGSGRGENASPGGGMSDAMRSRYGLPAGGEAMRSRYGGGTGGAAPATAYSSGQPAMTPGFPAAPAVPAVVLEEKPLRIILQVDLIKPRPLAEVSRRTSTPRAPVNPDPASADASAETPDDGSAEPAAPSE